MMMRRAQTCLTRARLGTAFHTETTAHGRNDGAEVWDKPATRA